MVRSIDPFAHIESHCFVIGNLIRFINQFWYLGDESELDAVINKENIQNMIQKIKKFNKFEVKSYLFRIYLIVYNNY